MVEATIDNDPVSMTLSSESTTVPAGETWRVTITCQGNLDIDGQTLGAPVTFETVLTEGTTVNSSGNTETVHIGGWKV